MKKHLVKEKIKYIIATFEENEQVAYLISLHQGKYSFTYDIALATKTTNRTTAEMVKNNYFIDTGDNIQLVTLPLVVSYTLIEE